MGKLSGRGSRQKGARSEIELFSLLNGLLGTDVFRRNISQTRAGGCDNEGHLKVAIEVKRQETLALPAWIRQAREQAAPDQVPVLAWRQSRTPWQVAVLMTPEQFIDYYKRLNNDAAE